MLHRFSRDLPSSHSPLEVLAAENELLEHFRYNSFPYVIFSITLSIENFLLDLQCKHNF